ncbi:hypothetical protein AGRA3207_006429 [Actinomadura graeca]|uniref:Uncharacterized protein n=1 Tax=Actinomadura graeca TaxID=2750812 RepID=A0ABX8R7P4_9ACTN|nr:hypothetical protein [Actinomadura graeca]QXJ24998.1 hypothetical protein AGRA3207_006429 [Actinomadura graeca]
MTQKHLDIDDETAKAELQAEFPGWSMILTRDTGRWWAIRWPPVKGWRGVRVVTEVDADTAALLRERLWEVAEAEREAGL